MDHCFIRVDNRLVHGQIIETWLPFLKATRIIVVNDEAAGSFFRETVIRMAVPRDVELMVCGVEEFSRTESILEGGVSSIVLFSSVEDVLRAYDAGFRFSALNIGNIYHEDWSLQLSTSVCLDDADIRRIRRLISSGIAVELRSVPRDRARDFKDLLAWEGA